MASSRRRRDVRNRAFGRANESDSGVIAPEPTKGAAPKAAFKPSNIVGQRRQLMWMTGLGSIGFFLYGVYVLGKPLVTGMQGGFDRLTQVSVQTQTGSTLLKNVTIREQVSLELGRATSFWFFSVILLILCFWHRKHWKSGT